MHYSYLIRAHRRNQRLETLFPKLMWCAPVVLACWAVGVQAEDMVFDREGLTDGEIQLVAQRLHDGTSGRAQSVEAQERRAAGLDPQVSALLDVQNQMQDDPLFGSFADVQPTDAQDIDFARGYFDPVRTLAQPYSLPASEDYRSETVARAMHDGFVYTRKHVYPGCPKPGNWWVWAKQMPDCLCDVLALVSKELDDEDRTYITDVLDYLLGTGPIPGSGYHTGKAGKDAVNTLKAGVLCGDRDRIARAWECMENEVGPYLLEVDGTPLMTVIKSEYLGVSLPYIYEGYGTVVEWASLTEGTAMALRPETTGKISEYLLGLGRWNTVDDTEVAWISYTPYRVFWHPAQTRSFAGRMAGLDPERADQLEAMTKGTDSPPEGIRYWPMAETLIVRWPGFYGALPMASRNRHPISWSYKNRFLHIGNKWYYGRDGHLVLATRPEDLDVNLTYTLDWRRLTGVTHDDGSVLDSDELVLQGADDDYWQPAYLLCRNPVAGAAVLGGRDAVAGIEVSAGDIRARKSFFFLSDPEMIVAMGSHIQGRGQAETIVHTFPVDDAELVVNGVPVVLEGDTPLQIETPAWVYGPCGGYYFPDPGTVSLLAETRPPSFEDVGNPPPERQPDVPAQTFVSILLDHGEDQEDAAYVWVHWPKAKRNKMRLLTRKFRRRCRCVRNKTGHALEFGSFSGITFFEAGEIEGWTADRPCFVAVRKDGKTAHLAAYEPSFTDCRLTLQAPFQWEGAPLAGVVRPDGHTLVIECRSATVRSR